MSDERRPSDPKVGPADPATRRRLLEEKMRENAKGDKTYQRTPATERPRTNSGTPVIQGQRRANAIDDVVTRTQRGDDPNELSKKIRNVDREWTR